MPPPPPPPDVPEWAFDRAHPTWLLRALGVSRAELDSDLWDAPFHGVRRWGGPGADPAADAIASAAALVPAGCALGGWASAYHQGIGCLDGNTGRAGAFAVPIVSTQGHQLRKRPGIRPVRSLVAPEDIVVIDCVAVVVLDLAGVQQMCMSRSLTEAVVVADMVTSRRTGEPTIPMARLARRVMSIKKTRGIVQTREALALADDRSASPEETRTRMVWVRDAGLPRPLVNRPVFSLTGTLLGYPDLLDPAAGHVHEVDGGQHREIEQHTADNAREERFENHGLVVSRSTSSDRANLWGLAERMRATNRRGRARDQSRDRWTLTPPPGWVEPAPRHPR